MKLTFIHPAIGHRAGESYIRTWQMESLPVANLTALTPPAIDLAFYDDRMEAIPFNEPTDAVAIPIETYTAARAYQIASEYRARGCHFPCEFCAIQTFFGRTYRRRPADDVVAELQALKKEKRVFFFVDDNFAADLKDAKPLLRELAKVGVRWITQMSIDAAHDE